MPLFKQERLNLPKTLADKYIVPPFSVFNTHQPYFRKRLRMWYDLGVVSKAGRSEHLSYDNRRMDKGNNEKSNGTSVFNPVLTEVIYKWFCVSRGNIYDPFAGGITRGAVASMLGYNYTGIDISTTQVECSEQQYEELKEQYDIKGRCNWYIADSSNMLDNTSNRLTVHPNTYDLVFTCPPYYNLEKYSNNENDLSNLCSYDEFIERYKTSLSFSNRYLKDDSFFVIVVSDVRDKKTGVYYPLVADTTKILQELGLKYYNEIILYNDTGNLAITSGNYLDRARKVGRQHQNVLVFYKGDTKNIKDKFGEVN